MSKMAWWTKETSHLHRVRLGLAGTILEMEVREGKVRREMGPPILNSRQQAEKALPSSDHEARYLPVRDVHAVEYLVPKRVAHVLARPTYRHSAAAASANAEATSSDEGARGSPPRATGRTLQLAPPAAMACWAAAPRRGSEQRPRRKRRRRPRSRVAERRRQFETQRALQAKET